MLSRKTRTKMQDLRRVSSWKPKKEKKSILARSKSEGGSECCMPVDLRLPGPGPPMVPRKFVIIITILSDFFVNGLIK